ncbi:MAG TPA: YihY/virulence factor BrkB family protein [Deltaproteobacteria bacterium]|nr:YihY/virulence factor BrkB family protein [Deltaproteobacteria bacterium]
MRRAAEDMTNPFSILHRSFERFWRHDGFNKAAAISFYALFSLIPILFLLTAFLGFILGVQAGLLDRIIELVREGLPYLSDSLVEDVRGLARNAPTFGWVGLLTLVWTADFVLSAMQDSLADIFEVREARGFLMRRLTGMAVILVGLVTALFSLGMTALVEVVRKIDITVFDIDLSEWLVRSLTFSHILPALLLVLSVAAVFKIIAGRSMGFVDALWGSVFFTLLWEAAKTLFKWYISNFPSYNKFYGSLGTVMILLVWIYYSTAIFLYSASVSATLAGRGRERGGPGRGGPPGG